MNISRLCALLSVAMLMNGCVLWHHRQKPVVAVGTPPRVATTATNAPTPTLKPIITPDNSLRARVADYNATGRFVVLSFPVGQMPKLNQTMFLYRDGLKVGEARITGPQQNNDIVADLVTGTAQAGDEVREQ